MNWQPIATAPKDGTCYVATDCVGVWQENCPPLYAPGQWELWEGVWFGESSKHTAKYWAPMPELPKEDQP